MIAIMARHVIDSSGALKLKSYVLPSRTENLPSASFQPDEQPAMKPKPTGKTVYYVLDLDAEPSAECVAALARLSGHPIDLSDIPEQAIDDTWYMPNWPARLAAQAKGIEHGAVPTHDAVLC